MHDGPMNKTETDQDFIERIERELTAIRVERMAAELASPYWQRVARHEAERAS